MWSITKTRQENDVTNYTSVISVEYTTKLSKPMTKTRQGNDVIDCTGLLYAENKIEVS